ncbi:hypothetical protein EGW08_011051 [Elysia chlorotica]|uniref:Schlafen AlbA-2 domain-containing protein n=1 Tax=Elysia chlorotica TaxID=188477 RepID=A0A3S0ZRT7_ELYCH|nr:hypothetical protein EGW08_011051 [Elysia chlorotica]
MAECKGKAACSRATANGSEIKGVYIRPLFTDRGPDEMAKNLFRLLYCVGVKSTDICQITVSKYEGAASVHVRSAECEAYLLTIFQDPASIMNQYDLRRITKNPLKLNVTKIATQGQRNQVMPVRIDSKGKAPATNSKKVNECKSGNEGLQADRERQKQQEALTDISNHESEIVAGPESSSTSLTYSLCGFEQLESEEDRTKKSYRCNAATSTTDVPMFDRKKKARQIDDGGKAQGKTKCDLATMERDSRSQTIQCPVHVKDEYGVSKDVVEIVLNHGCISKIRNLSLDSPKLAPETGGIIPSDTEPILEHFKPGLSSTESSPQGTSKSYKTSPTVSSSEDVIKLHAKTSTPAVPPCGCPETIFYHLQQHVGAETRHAEFKRGGIVREQGLFRSVVGKYVCGFLNSEGGTIYFGISDDGKVLGIKVDACTEETLRGDVDFAVRSLIEPTVDPSEYSVNFARIMRPDGELSEDLRVLEVCVKPRRPPKRGRFTCDNVVYIRRDGSLQALSRSARSRTGAGRHGRA